MFDDAKAKLKMAALNAKAVLQIKNELDKCRQRREKFRALEKTLEDFPELKKKVEAAQRKLDAYQKKLEEYRDVWAGIKLAKVTAENQAALKTQIDTSQAEVSAAFAEYKKAKAAAKEAIDHDLKSRDKYLVNLESKTGETLQNDGMGSDPKFAKDFSGAVSRFLSDTKAKMEMFTLRTKALAGISNELDKCRQRREKFRALEKTVEDTPDLKSKVEAAQGKLDAYQKKLEEYRDAWNDLNIDRITAQNAKNLQSGIEAKEKAKNEAYEEYKKAKTAAHDAVNQTVRKGEQLTSKVKTQALDTIQKDHTGSDLAGLVKLAQDIGDVVSLFSRK